jgi:predicted ester cyclase
MPAQDNKAAVRRFYEELINGRNVEIIDELLTADSVDHTFGSQGVDASKQFFGMLFEAFPDLSVEIHDVIAEGELVAARVTYSGSHEVSSASRLPAAKPGSAGWTSPECKTAGRRSIGAGRTWPACSSSSVSCLRRARLPSEHQARQSLILARPSVAKAG